MINGAYARPIVLRSLGGTQLMCPHTHTHRNTCATGRRWFSFSPPHSGDLEEHTHTEREEYITCSGCTPSTCTAIYYM